MDKIKPPTTPKLTIKEIIKIRTRTAKIEKENKRIQQENKSKTIRQELINKIEETTKGEEAPFYNIKINEKTINTEDMQKMATNDLITLSEQLIKELEKIK